MNAKFKHTNNYMNQMTNPLNCDIVTSLDGTIFSVHRIATAATGLVYTTQEHFYGHSNWCIIEWSTFCVIATLLLSLVSHKTNDEHDARREIRSMLKTRLIWIRNEKNHNVHDSYSFETQFNASGTFFCDTQTGGDERKMIINVYMSSIKYTFF